MKRTSVRDATNEKKVVCSLRRWIYLTNIRSRILVLAESLKIFLSEVTCSKRGPYVRTESLFFMCRKECPQTTNHKCSRSDVTNSFLQDVLDLIQHGYPKDKKLVSLFLNFQCSERETSGNLYRKTGEHIDSSYATCIEDWHGGTKHYRSEKR